MNIKIIGDPHGKLPQYKEIVLKAEYYGDKTISLGDNGFESEWIEGEKFLGGLDGGFENHKWLGGNHDFYPNDQFKQSLGDFGFWNNLFFVRGAKSIDRAHRIEGVDWFREEELSYSQMSKCYDLFDQHRPDFVISHTCPQSISESVFGFSDKNSTSIFLEDLFQLHQPKVWIFGHMHTNITHYAGDTIFICLAELQTTTLVI